MTENVYLFWITESELSAIDEMLENAHTWHAELLRLQQENANLLALIKLHEQTIRKLEGLP